MFYKNKFELAYQKFEIMKFKLHFLKEIMHNNFFERLI